MPCRVFSPFFRLRAFDESADADHESANDAAPALRAGIRTNRRAEPIASYFARNLDLAAADRFHDQPLIHGFLPFLKCQRAYPSTANMTGVVILEVLRVSHEKRATPNRAAAAPSQGPHARARAGTRT